MYILVVSGYLIFQILGYLEFFTVLGSNTLSCINEFSVLISAVHHFNISSSSDGYHKNARIDRHFLQFAPKYFHWHYLRLLSPICQNVACFYFCLFDDLLYFTESKVHVGLSSPRFLFTRALGNLGLQLSVILGLASIGWGKVGRVQNCVAPYGLAWCLVRRNKACFLLACI